MTPNVGDIVRRNASRWPRRLALSYHGHERTWAQLDERTSRLAAGMASAMREDDRRVGAIAANSIELVELYLAAAKAGRTLVLLRPALTADELASHIELGRVGLLATDQARGEVCRSALSALSAQVPPPQLVALDGDVADAQDLEDLFASDDHLAGPGSDVFALALTSGTTGDPKAVPITHGNFIAGITNMALEAGMRRHHRSLTLHPLCTAGALGASLFPPMLLGCPTWILDYRLQYDLDGGPLAMCDAIESLGINQIVAPVFFFADERTASFDLSSLVNVVNGVSSVGRVARLQAAAERLGGNRIMNAYGMTESSGTPISVMPREQLAQALSDGHTDRLLSVGTAVASLDLQILGEHGPVSPGSGEAGEVLVRGPSVITSYLGGSDHSDGFRGGWLPTGDIGRLDAEGNLYLVDRLKDVIRSGNATIFSQEVEAVVSAHPAVAEAAVIGVTDPDWGEAPHAVVRLVDTSTHVDSEEIILWVKDHLASYKKPRTVHFVDDFPRNSNGKILKRVLRDTYSDAEVL